MTTLSRRTLLIGGGSVVLAAAAGAVLLEQGVLPGRAAVERRLGMTGPAGVVPTSRTGSRIEGSFTSAARGGAETGWTISYPPGSAAGDPLPVVVSLHGYGGDHRSSFDHGMHLDRFQAAARAAGEPAVAIASIDGGNDYWHPRASGRDPHRMLVDEFLPPAARPRVGRRAARAVRLVDGGRTAHSWSAAPSGRSGCGPSQRARWRSGRPRSGRPRVRSTTQRTSRSTT
ncbi:hypothetical protein [Curtobacterium sp. MCPF17_052]|uniref:hypothetical protein n=1 Tax=Curtobacterium sp. MCPF17_052 TaxID=2175655 RepID=UPI0024DFD5E1|nr:hypothetical protein [Curtobacterium sp. MCPF17_052]WIB11315.1 hypothetical protein DEJ36_09555 [Curtobacterium sp. MCPF17_052]